MDIFWIIRNFGTPKLLSLGNKSRKKSFSLCIALTYS